MLHTKFSYLICLIKEKFYPSFPYFLQFPTPWNHLCSLCFYGFSFFKDSTYKWYHAVSVFSFWVYFTYIIPSSFIILSQMIGLSFFKGWIISHFVCVYHIFFIQCIWLVRRQKQSDGQMEADPKGSGWAVCPARKERMLVSWIQAVVTDTGRKGWMPGKWLDGDLIGHGSGGRMRVKAQSGMVSPWLLHHQQAGPGGGETPEPFLVPRSQDNIAAACLLCRMCTADPTKAPIFLLPSHLGWLVYLPKDVLKAVCRCNQVTMRLLLQLKLLIF